MKYYLELTEHEWVYEGYSGDTTLFTFLVFGPPLIYRNKPR
jgi:hypothetical protein